MKRGKLFVFEGIDGSGKTTQAKRLRDYFLETGQEVQLFREPGATTVGEMIRKILLSGSELDSGIDPLAEFLLFAASRRELVRQFVKPSLEDDHIVILDRFGDSSVAYQGYGRGIDLDFIRDVNSKATFDIEPDLVFLLDMDFSQSLERIAGGDDRMEKSGDDFYRKVRKGYLEIASANPDQYAVIDGSKEPDEIADQVILLLNKRFFYNKL